MATKAKITVAAKNKLITKSTFKNYDACLNSYVGCEFGCSYCYVRFFIKDDEKEWGEFVRVREHMANKLPQELASGYLKLGVKRAKLDNLVPVTEAAEVAARLGDSYKLLSDDLTVTINKADETGNWQFLLAKTEGQLILVAVRDGGPNETYRARTVQEICEKAVAWTDQDHLFKLPISKSRLVIGTMTDPYQPQEKKARITRTALEILTNPKTPQFDKVGIFTRSPLVLGDLDLIKKLPKARVHFTITPFPHEVMRAIEPYSPITETRWQTIKKLKDAGIRVHVNVSPIMPGMSEGFIAEFTKRLAEIGVEEYFVDPMQPYRESFEAFRQACLKVPTLDWKKIESVMTDKDEYLDWKHEYYQTWNKERKKYEKLAPNQLPIWSDHENKVWVDMRTGKQMDHRYYGDG